MFRLIGLAVVIFLIVVGWDQISSVYEGSTSAKDAATEIRSRSAEALRPKDDSRSGLPGPNSSATPPPPANQPGDKDPFAEANKLLGK